MSRLQRPALRKGGDDTVKLITAIVKPDKLDDVMRAVSGAGAHGLTVTEVRGFGQQYGHRAAVRSADREILVLPKLRVDIVVQDQVAGLVADSIAKSVNTGTIGDGKIWICPVDSVLRVRTGERGLNAV